MAYLNTRNLSFIFGAVFMLVAAVGYVPNPLISHDGFFAVNHEHNIVHALTGLFLLIGPLAMTGKEHLVLIIAGLIYGLVGVAGFIMGPGMLFGIIMINAADNVLHIGLATVLVLSGIMAPRRMPLIPAGR